MEHIKNPHKLSCLIGKTIKEIKCIEEAPLFSPETEVKYLFEATDGTKVVLMFTEGHCCP